MYSVGFYGKMLADVQRTDAYVRALEQTVKPGSVVMDLGCGPGLFGLLACNLGARRVYAIEPDSIIEIAKACARANGVSDRIEFIQDSSTKVDFPERADVIVADLRGVLPLFSTNLPSIQDATKRFLADDGILIAGRDRLFVAAVQDSDRYEKLVSPWEGKRGVPLAPGRTVALNSWFKAYVKQTDLLSSPVCWHTIDYYNINNFDACSNISVETSKTGTVHGVAVWFESDLCEGISVSSKPGNDDVIYGQGFFPLLHPIEVRAGDKLEVHLRADFVKEDYVWTWETSVSDSANPTRLRKLFKQSTLLGTPLSPMHLKKRATSFTPTPTQDALISSFVISLMDSHTSVEDLAKKVAQRFPAVFPTATDAVDTVADISVRFSK